MVSYQEMCDSKLIIIAILLLLCLVYFNTNNIRENYGGAVKKIQRIPKTTCYNICEQYYRSCMNSYAHVNAYGCATSLHNCKMECNYSDFHRM